MVPSLYSQRVATCGCRGVPDGQHLAGCPRSSVRAAPLCPSCGYRAKSEMGRCGICGAPREERRREGPRR